MSEQVITNEKGEKQFSPTPYHPYQHAINQLIAERLANLAVNGLPSEVDPDNGVAGPILRAHVGWSKCTTLSLIHDILKSERYGEIIKGLELLCEAGVPLNKFTQTIIDIKKGVVPCPRMR